MGLVFYSVIAAGLGSLLPISLRSGMGVVGIRFSLGYALMVVPTYVAHIILQLPLGATLAVSVILCLAGFVAQLRRRNDLSAWRGLLVHPAFLLIAAGGVAILLNGGVGYIPYGQDEFSHWLATPRLINLGGGWANVVNSLHLPYYTPGWQLTLLLPWQWTGNEDFGLSAAAPFVLHVTVIALIYDIAVFVVRRKGGIGAFRAVLMAWGFVLLFLAAEGMGRLWSYTLLIEPPQIYSYATVILLIYAAEVTGQDRKPLYAIAGAVLASAYLYKVAALVFIPAIIGLACIVLLNRKKSLPDRLSESWLTVALLAGPILVAIISWFAAVEARSCSPLSLSAAQLAQAMSLDWQDLARRFGGAVWTYGAGYKTALSLAAGLGVIGALAAGTYRATLILVLVSAVYFTMLYIYHLTCMGAYYFETLNSIPRFTRVPLQVFHALGLVMLLDTALSFAEKRGWTVSGVLAQLGRRRWIAGVFVTVIVVLGAWQGRQIYRSVIDTTTRAYQNVDQRIPEIQRAANRIESLRGDVLPESPVLTILSQGGDNAVINYAQFYAMDYRDGKLKPRFSVAGEVSWAPEPVNVWQTKASIEDVVRQLAKADIIWPINVDPWLMKALSRLIPDRSCLSALPDRALICETVDGSTIRYKCIEKQDPAAIRAFSG